MQNLNNILKILLENRIDFVLIGGYAAVLYGASQVTQDIDICASLNLNDLEKLRNVLRQLHPIHRINPNVQPSLDDYPKKGDLIKNYYLKTDQGVLDIIDEVISVGSYERVRAAATTIKLFGYECKVISIEDLISSKKSMNRDKDLIVLKELLSIRDKKI